MPGGGGGLRKWVQAKAGQSTMPGSQLDTILSGSLHGPPPGGPSGTQGYVVSARQVHLPHCLCPAHASTLLSPAPAPYGNDLLLPDLTHMAHLHINPAKPPLASAAHPLPCSKPCKPPSPSFFCKCFSSQ